MLSNQVSSVCKTTIVKVNYSKTLEDAGKEMVRQKVGAIIVVDDDDKPVGIITERDFLNTTIQENKPLNEIKIDGVMSSPVFSINRSASLEKAADKMFHRNIRRLLVVDDNNLAVGFCTVRDILEATNEMMSDY
jgi:predicted transcriptional regulator